MQYTIIIKITEYMFWRNNYVLIILCVCWAYTQNKFYASLRVHSINSGLNIHLVKPSTNFLEEITLGRNMNYSQFVISWIKIRISDDLVYFPF